MILLLIVNNAQFIVYNVKDLVYHVYYAQVYIEIIKQHHAGILINY